MARLFRALQALLRRPRTRRGGRPFHDSCCGAPSGGPVAAAADGDSTDPIRASEAPTKTKNLTDDVAARRLTVADACLDSARPPPGAAPSARAAGRGASMARTRGASRAMHASDRGRGQATLLGLLGATGCWPSHA